MHNLNICSLNVRGIKNRINRRALFKTIKSYGFDITAMQETYINEVGIKQIEKELRGVVHSASCVGRSKGLITHFSSKIKSENVTLLETTDRLIISKVKQNDIEYFVINVYAPCIEHDKLLFYNFLEETIKQYVKSDQFGNIICMGDFNCVVNNSLDIISGKKHSDRTVHAFNEFIKHLNLKDKCREYNADSKVFTWNNKDFSSARRLDYIFTGVNFDKYNLKPEIKNLPFTDHKAVTLDIKFKNFERGAGIFKIDSCLFTDTNYKKIIIDTINDIKNSYSHLNDGLIWELIKVHIKEKSIKYAKLKQKVTNEKDKSNRRELSIIENKLIKDPSNKYLAERTLHLKNEIELKLINDTKSSSIRAGIKWIEQGEKNNKYFLGLEKTRVEKNTIDTLKRGGNTNEITTNNEEILEETRQFYSNLYTERKQDDAILNNFNNFKHGIKINKLNDNQRMCLDNEITISEMLNALKFMNNGSSPGVDGIPTEFYKVFWEDIKKPLYNSFIHSLNTGILSLSQRKGVLSLLYKGNNSDKELLKNWRPISLVNSDYKILTKLFSIRIKRVMADLVHENQTGFIKGRNISQTLRELDDIIEREKHFKNSHFLLAVDFEKAFDTISTLFVTEMCKEYGFGPSFLRWIDILMNDRISCVKNNGYVSHEFKMERGLRQGCPMSPLLFVLAVELLANKIRQDSNLNGIMINEKSVRIKQYADDTTLLLKDEIDIREVLSRLKEFENVSGLKINKNKSYLICPGNPLLVGSEIEGIIVSKEVKILGVWFDSDIRAKHNKKNWETKITNTKHILENWSKRDLSTFGKVLILKTFALSNFIYLMQSIGMPENIMRELNTLFYKFIWKKDMQSDTRTFDKVKRNVMSNDYEFGGIKMFDLEKHQHAFYLDWAENFLKDGEKEWKEIPCESFKHLGGKAVFEGDITKKDLKGLFTSYSNFWNEVLETWHRYKFDQKEKSVKINKNTVLFNNMNISLKGKPLWSPECIKNNVLRLKDILSDKRIITYTQFVEKYPEMKYPMIPYNIISNAVKQILKSSSYEQNEESNVSSPYFGINKVGNIGRKGFLNLIKENLDPYVLQLWKNKFNIEIESEHWLTAINASKETRLRTMHWKIMHNIYPTNILLSKMKIKETQNCEWCDCQDFPEHFFVECKKIKHLWKEIETKLKTYCSARIKF